MSSVKRDSAIGEQLYTVATDVGDGLRQEVVVLNPDGSNPALGMPSGATAVNATSGSVANAVAAAAMPAVADKTNYVTGFSITGSGATAAAVVNATLAGLAGGATMSYIVVVPAGATASITPTVVSFSRPIPASAANTAITLSVPAFGAGNTNASANIHGFVA